MIFPQKRKNFFSKFSLFLFLYVIFFWGLLSVNTFAEESCSKNTICIITQDTNDGTEFYVKNLKAYDVTITLGFTKLENMQADVDTPYTETIPGYKKIKIMNIFVVNYKKGFAWAYNFYWVPGSIYAKHNDNYSYSLPYTSGSKFMVFQGFNGSFSHNDSANQYAIDWSMPVGTKIYAAREGVVVDVMSKYSTGGPDKKYEDYANYIIIKQSDGTLAHYLHLKKDGVKVKIGQNIKKGEFIGVSGNTGFSSGPHLHFAVTIAVDGETMQSVPMKFTTTKGKGFTLQEKQYYKAP